MDNAEKVLRGLLFVLILTLIAYLLGFPEIIVMMIVLSAIIIALLYSEKRRIPHELKEYDMPREYLRIMFTPSAIRRRGNGNMAKQISISNGKTIKVFPYHPLFASIYASFMNYPVFDETFRENEPILPIKGEINIPKGLIVDDD